MMELHLRALVIDTHATTMEELETAYASEFEFEYLDFVNTVHKAIQYHMESDFNLCFIGEEFAQGDLTSFFADYKKLNKEYPCVFVQVREKVDLDFDRSSLESIGFATVISKSADYRDKDAIWKALKAIIERKEHSDTLSRLDSIIDNLTEEIDKVALERKRGAKVKLSTIYAKYLRDSASKYEGLADEFYGKLVDSTESAEPFEATKIDVPDEILAKKLPHLHKDTYTGQSHRVWEKLLHRHGSGDLKKNKASEDPVATDEEAEKEPEKGD